MASFYLTLSSLVLVLSICMPTRCASKMTPDCESLFLRGRSQFLSVHLPTDSKVKAPEIKAFIQEVKEANCVIPQTNMICTATSWLVDLYFQKESTINDVHKVNILRRSLSQFLDVCVAGAQPQTPPPVIEKITMMPTCNALINKIVKMVSERNTNYADLQREFQNLATIQRCLLDTGYYEGCELNKVLLVELMKIAEAGAGRLNERQKADLQKFFEIKLGFFFNLCTYTDGGFMFRKECEVAELAAMRGFTSDLFDTTRYSFSWQNENINYVLQYCALNNALHQEQCVEYQKMLLPLVDMTRGYSRGGEVPDDDAYNASFRILREGFSQFVNACVHWDDFDLNVSRIQAKGVAECEGPVKDLRGNLSYLVANAQTITKDQMILAVEGIINVGRRMFRQSNRSKVYEDVILMIADRAKSVIGEPKRVNYTLSFLGQIAVRFFLEEYEPSLRCAQELVPAPRPHPSSFCERKLRFMQKDVVQSIINVRTDDDKLSRTTKKLKEKFMEFDGLIRCYEDEWERKKPGDSISAMCREALRSLKSSLGVSLFAPTAEDFMKKANSLNDKIELYVEICQ